MHTPFTTHITIKFHQADPAGIMFFAQIYTISHDVFEQFVQACGFTWKTWFLNGPTMTPIRHSECDYLRPFKAGETYRVELSVIEFSSSSFKIRYDFFHEQTKQATVQIVHVCLDAKSFQKTQLPAEIKTAFQPYYKEVADGEK